MTRPPHPDPRSNQQADSAETVQLAAEHIEVGVRERVTGTVQVSTRTETFEQRVDETLLSTTSEVERISIERELQPGEPVPEVRVEAGVTIVPIMEERLVIEKRLVLVEEIRVVCAVDKEDISVPVTLRRQRADVERVQAPPDGSEDPE